MRNFCNDWLSFAIAGSLVCILLGCSASESESPAPAAKKITPENTQPAGGSADYETADPPEDQPSKLTLNPPAVVEPVEVKNTQAPSVGSSYGTRGMSSPNLEGWNSSAAKSSDFEPPTANLPGSSFPQAAAPEFASNAPNYSANPNDSTLPPPNPPLPIEEPDSVQRSESIQTPTERATDGFTEVNVFYATDRNQVQISPTSVVPLQAGLVATVIMLLSAVGFLVFNRLKSSVAMAGLAGIIFLVLCGMQNDAPTRDGFTYGSERGSFVRGVATVSIPDSHQRGIVERPSIVRLEFVEDETKHVVLAKATELDRDQFFQQMSDELTQSSEQDLLVFIHGFNVDFDSAVRRTAQIATDLSFEGVPVCYSWPSQGSLVGYTADENAVIWTVPHLRDFLLELAERSHARSINIIAHSMGNRAVTASLAEVSRQVSPKQLPMFDQIVLAAPDVDADYFRSELAPRLADVGRHVTLYASSDDQALVASKHLHGGYPRAGESGDNLVVVPEIETIDVSGIDLSLLGHSYYGNSESILRDLFDVVRNRLPASQRSGLISRQLRNSVYWKLPQTQISELNETPIR